MNLQFVSSFYAKSKNSERGSSVVEFAIVLPIFLLLIFSIIDYGRYFYTRVMVTNASIEVASALTRGVFDSNSGNPETVRQFVENKVAAGVANFSQLDVNRTLNLVITRISPPNVPTDISNSFTAACENGTQQVKVDVGTTFKPVINYKALIPEAFFPASLFPGSVNSSTTMRCLR